MTPCTSCGWISKQDPCLNCAEWLLLEIARREPGQPEVAYQILWKQMPMPIWKGNLHTRPSMIFSPGSWYGPDDL